MAPPAPIPFDEIDTVFLDAGNTILCWDYAFASGLIADQGFPCDPATLARAEAAARPRFSWLISGGTSTETPEAFLVYVRSILDALPCFCELVEAERTRAAARLLRAIHTPEAQNRLWSRVPPDLPPALQRLREGGLRLVVVSNSDGTVEARLAAAGVRDLLHSVVDSHVVGSEKPDRAIFEHALRVAGSRPERTVHVGDLYHADVLGARGAGLHAVLLDPFGDWHDVDCERARDAAEFARRILVSRNPGGGETSDGNAFPSQRDRS
jgi:HAD superfamily hydrolase (TIGR01509 family)